MLKRKKSREKDYLLLQFIEVFSKKESKYLFNSLFVLLLLLLLYNKSFYY